MTSPLPSSRSWTLADIIAQLGGRLVGEEALRNALPIRQVATLISAGPGDISFLANAKYRSQLKDCKATAVIVSQKAADNPGDYGGVLLAADDPYVYFARVAQLLNPAPEGELGVHPTAVVESDVPATASIGAHVWIGPGAVIGEGAIIAAGCRVGAGSKIGAHTRLYPNVNVYHGCVIGERVIIHGGTTIGADGFGFAREKDGRWVKIPQIGRVVIGDDVEIGANTTVDRGALDDTVIGDGVIIDNQVQIAHNVRIGRYTAIAGCTGIAGSTHIGERCMIGGAAMIIGHLNICDDVVISTCTMITKSITTPGVYTGTLPQQGHGDWMKNFAQLRHLDAMADKIRALERVLDKKESS